MRRAEAEQALERAGRDGAVAGPGRLRIARAISDPRPAPAQVVTLEARVR